jgi:chemotaxis protein CheC
MPRRFFSEDETDALTELVNIGVSGAATRLSRMLRRPVGLAVPAVGIVSAARAAEMMAALSPGPLVAVEQVFSGSLSGRALLILPASHRENLFRALVGEAEPDEALLNDALAETGNVVLQGCLGSIADLLQRPLSVSVPRVVSGEPAALLG